MLQALQAAFDSGCCARPIGQDAVAYRYKKNGDRYLLAVSGKARMGLKTVEEFCPALSRDEIEGCWELCEIGSDPLRHGHHRTF